MKKKINKHIPIGGGANSYNIRKKFLLQHKRPFKVLIEGSTIVVDEGEHKIKYVIGGRRDVKIMNCCKETKKLCTAFLSSRGPLSSSSYQNNYYNLKSVSSYIVSGGREIAYIDVDHCYWQIAFIYGLINEKTYLKYKDNREARLTAIGCLKRSKSVTSFRMGKARKRKVTPNPFAWVWDFVNYKAYLAMEAIRKTFGVFSYHTDGAYLPAEHIVGASKLLIDKHKLKCKVLLYTIEGYAGHYVVLREALTGEYKRTNLGLTKEMKDALPCLNYNELTKQPLSSPPPAKENKEVKKL